MFSVTAEERVQISNWLEKIKPQVLAKAKIKSPIGDGEPYYGAVGGGLTYCFTPTSLGTVFIVREHFTGLELNLTDYDSW